MMNAFVRAQVPLYEFMDIALTVDAPRYACRVPYSAAVNSHVGTVHAAMQWAAAEMLGGLVVIDTFSGLDDVFLVVKSVQIDFLKPARSDIEASVTFDEAAQDRLRKGLAAGGDTEFTLPVEVRDAAGVVVATMSARYLIRPRRAASES